MWVNSHHRWQFLSLNINTLRFKLCWVSFILGLPGTFGKSPCYGLLLFIRSVVSDSLWPHGLQHARLPCSTLSPGVCSNSCPLSWWCHLTISSSATLFSYCLWSFPASGSFPMSQLLTSGGQSITASDVSPSSEYSGLISLLSKGLSRVFSSTTIWRHQFFGTQPSLWSNSHIHLNQSLWLCGSQ